MKLIRTFVENKKLAETSADVMPEDIVQTEPKFNDVASEQATEPCGMSDRDLVESLSKTMPSLLDAKASVTVKDGLVKTVPAPKAASKRVWDLEAAEDDPQVDDFIEPAPDAEPEVRQRVADDLLDANDVEAFAVPDPLTPRKPRQAGRVKTRIMGFASSNPSGEDVFERAENTLTANNIEFPVGWLVVTQGPGRGKQFTLQQLVTTIGRGEDQTISLNFGDDTISRNKHAAIAYDDQLNTCFIGYGGKANLVRLNGRPVLATEQLNNGDTICIGQTDLRFVELCGPDFSWSTPNGQESHVG